MSVEYHARRRGLTFMLGALVLGMARLAAAASFAHPGVRPGEAMTFRLYLGGIETGRARMSVGHPMHKDGRRLVAVHGQAETTSIMKIVARMDEDYQLVLDAGTLLPREVVSVEHGMRDRRIASRVDGRAIAHDVRLGEQRGASKRVAPTEVRDPLCAFFALRALALASGDVLRLDVLDGTVLWRTRLTVRREPLRLGDQARAREAIRIDGETARIDDAGRPLAGATRHLSVWMSDDGDRALLRMECDTDLGRAAIELTSYQRGGRGPQPELPGIVVTRR
jgi:hypothetical protein